ncbi:MAG: thiamine phosphate synthase [Armatimonadetes bacterium]|nr:thiamine phosphate synthase [Armatimonadota bacterium]
MLSHVLRSRLYAITPVNLAGTGELADFVKALVAGGVGLIQYRAKGLTARQMVEDCQRILHITRPARVPLLVDDRVAVALAVGAEGVHVGVTDMPVAYTRRLMGPHAIVGATTQTPELARQAEQGGASYVSVGPMFATPTAPEKTPVGPQRIAEVRAACKLPVCAIGGITDYDTLEQVALARPDLVAVVRALAEAEDIVSTTRQWVRRVEQLLGGGFELK